MYEIIENILQKIYGKYYRKYTEKIIENILKYMENILSRKYYGIEIQKIFQKKGK